MGDVCVWTTPSQNVHIHPPRVFTWDDQHVQGEMMDMIATTVKTAGEEETAMKEIAMIETVTMMTTIPLGVMVCH